MRHGASLNCLEGIRGMVWSAEDGALPVVLPPPERDGENAVHREVRFQEHRACRFLYDEACKVSNHALFRKGRPLHRSPPGRVDQAAAAFALFGSCV